MIQNYSMTAGRAEPLGATFDGDGVNFAVYSEHAGRIVLCLFNDDDEHEFAVLELPERDGDIWHGYVAGLRPGQRYGYRAYGRYEPEAGYRFNHNKLLLDPYARHLTGHPAWNDALMGYQVGAKQADASFDTTDSAPYMPRCVVTEVLSGVDHGSKPDIPANETVIYEAHVKGLTKLHPAVAKPGTFLSVASDPMLEHFDRLGITAVELLPVHAFLNDRFLVKQGLTNYWGYQSIGYFAPDPRYLSQGKTAEFREMVSRLHSAGIEVILDVVYNHTGEGNEMGPTLSFRGLDNLNYYRLAENRRHYVNDTGTGNTLNVEHPMVLRLVMDSLRYWAENMGVDGFRFDLCSTLGRTDAGFDRNASFFKAIRQDPVLANVKLIAEPWDIGPGGYQLGAFPPPFMEWNDQFRDGVRQFWRGDLGSAAGLAERLTGSARQFDHSGRRATTSVNFISAHDGFTLQDIVSFSRKHNEANGEGGRDGHNENHTDNMGVEGSTDDPKINTARARRKRNMMATLLLSQGTPMILAGDEIGNSQNGNNNAYCQDNETSWIDWNAGDREFLDFVSRMIAFRKEHPILRQTRFLHSRERATDGKEDLFWRRADGKPMTEADWNDPALRLVAVEMRTASGTPAYASLEYAIFAVFNAGEEIKVRLPDTPQGEVWCSRVDTARPTFERRRMEAGSVLIEADSVRVFELEAKG